MDGGISFGAVIAFIFADLLILPILNIYRRYYGIRMMPVVAGSFYLTMVLAGYAVELVFGGLGLVPDRAGAHLPDEGVTWNYSTWLNIAFLLVTGALLIRFGRTGGGPMPRMMGGEPDGGHDGGPEHAGHSAHSHHL